MPIRAGADHVELVLPARPSYLALARVIITGVAATAPSLQESRLSDLRLIVSEVYTNAMEANWAATEAALAAERPDGGRPTHDEVLAKEVELVVRDRGHGFANTDDPHPPLYDPTRLDFEHGLGIPLIQFLSDEVDYTTSDAGTEVRIVVRDDSDD